MHRGRAVSALTRNAAVCHLTLVSYARGWVFLWGTRSGVGAAGPSGAHTHLHSIIRRCPPNVIRLTRPWKVYKNSGCSTSSLYIPFCRTWTIFAKSRGCDLVYHCFKFTFPRSLMRLHLPGYFTGHLSFHVCAMPTWVSCLCLFCQFLSFMCSWHQPIDG